MRIEDVILFEKIVELGSISAAGKACRLTPTVSSDRLKRLENALGCNLLTRTTRSISLTSEGEQFLQKARDLIDTYDAAKHSVGQLSTAPNGKLTVAAPSLFANKILPDVITEFLRKYPHTQLNLNASDEVQNYTAQGIDLAIRVGWLKNSSMIARKVSENSRVLCASPEYLRKFGLRTHPKDLENHDCIIFIGENEWHLTNETENVLVRVNGRFDTNNASMATEAALAGFGIALRSVWDVTNHLQSGRLVQILKEYSIASKMSVYVVYPPRKFVSLTARAFVDILERHLSKIRM